jgi:glycosyltransferase involved in cell wall biosynthesis
MICPALHRVGTPISPGCDDVVVRGHPILLDLRDLGMNSKGVARVLCELAPRLVALAPDRYHVATTSAGVHLMGFLPPTQIHVVPSIPQAVWEQVALPATAARLGAGAIYSHRECGALWGPPLLLHVTEDPEVRWAREVAASQRERSRRRYSRMFMDRSLRRASVVASTRATAELLRIHHGVPLARARIVPLGVDHGRFRPLAADVEGGDFLFHLSSPDPRDNTALVLRAYAQFAVSEGAGAPDLVVGGGLGANRDELRELAGALGVAERVVFTGRLSDDDLVARYARSLAVINASSDEGFGLQPLEALACGALLISVGSPAVDEVVEGACIVLTDADPQAMAQAMARSSDRALRVRARVANPDVAARFDWDESAAILHSMLLELAVRR